MQEKQKFPIFSSDFYCDYFWFMVHGITGMKKIDFFFALLKAHLTFSLFHVQSNV